MDSPIEKNSNDLNLKNWKVKLFILNSEGSWDDYGCGVLSFLTESSIENDLYNYICIQKIQEDNENLIVDQEKIKKIKNENIIDCLLYVKIEKDYVFEKQHDFIISWADQLLNEEFALSFIDPIAANETWSI